LLTDISGMGVEMEVIESKSVRLKVSVGSEKRGPPPISVSPIMLMKTHGVKMSVLWLAIMLMKTQLHRGLCHYIYEKKRLGDGPSGRPRSGSGVLPRL
jgi:hypothetical protein